MIFKCLECDILKFRKSLFEFWKITFCFAPKKKFQKFGSDFQMCRIRCSENHKIIFGIYERRILVTSEDEIPKIRNWFAIPQSYNFLNIGN